MATLRMRMRRKKHCKLMIDQRRMWRTESIVGLTWEPFMSTGMSVRMATMHRMPMMDQRRMWRTKGKILESAKIRLYISNL